MNQVVAAKKSIIGITDRAAEQIANLLQSRKASNPDKGSLAIKVKIKTGGCSGLSYNFEFADEIGKFDEVIEDKGAKVVIDASAVMYVIGSTLDYFEEELKSGFIFTNPNEKGRCGCGESFHV